MNEQLLDGGATVSDKQLLQRAWDSLAAWKEVYPENWYEDDECLMDDLLTRIAELKDTRSHHQL